VDYTLKNKYDDDDDDDDDEMFLLPGLLCLVIWKKWFTAWWLVLDRLCGARRVDCTLWQIIKLLYLSVE
jgi:hypothetical protein